MKSSTSSVVPVSEMTDTDTTPIGVGETIRIPLMREQVEVSKRVVQTGEVVVGKRRVQDTQHVRETIREERLVVDDGVAGDGVIGLTAPNRLPPPIS